VVVPGEVDWSVDDGAVDVSAGGELAEPAGEVDSCLEQADMSAMAPTHNNRTLRFIRSPHCCNGTGTQGALILSGPRSLRSRKRRSGQGVRASHPGNDASCIPGGFRARRATLRNWYSSPFLQECGA